MDTNYRRERDDLAISIGTQDDGGYDNNKIKRRRTIRRAWKQLSSLQRSIVILLLVFVIIISGYYISYKGSSDSVDESPRQKKDYGDSHRESEKVKKILAKLKKKNEELIREDKMFKHIQPPHVPIAPDAGKDLDTHQKIVSEHIGKKEEPSEESEPKGDMARYDYFAAAANRNEKQEDIVRAFKHAWEGYKKYAWGHDELKPISRTYSEWFNVGLTIVDSLDTIIIMGLKEEYEEARSWIKEKQILNPNKDVNLFETTIRILGGFLSAFHLTGDELYKKKAVELGDKLLHAFNEKSHVPYSDVNLNTGKAHAPKWGPDSSTAEVTTIQLEFKDLSRITGDKKYEKAVYDVSLHVHELPKKDGLVPIFINANTGNFRSTATLTLGARGDSYYEYLLKQWLQTGKTQDMYKQDYLQAVEGIKKHLVKKSVPNQLTFVGELLSGRNFSPKMDHLACFLPGALMLGVENGLPEDHGELAKKLMYTCHQMYDRMPTKLSPEIAHFSMADGTKEDIIVKQMDSHNLLRPETVESLFYLHRFTGEEMYRDWGWQMFKAFEKFTKIPGAGYSSINSVQDLNKIGFRDKMESFFLAETLKYLYLLFSDDSDLMPLDKFIFNTEAHPLPIYKT